VASEVTMAEVPMAFGQSRSHGWRVDREDHDSGGGFWSRLYAIERPPMNTIGTMPRGKRLCMDALLGCHL